MWLWASRPVSPRASTFHRIAVGMKQEAVRKAPGPAPGTHVPCGSAVWATGRCAALCRSPGRGPGLKHLGWAGGPLRPGSAPCLRSLFLHPLGVDPPPSRARPRRVPFLSPARLPSVFIHASSPQSRIGFLRLIL